MSHRPDSVAAAPIALDAGAERIARLRRRLTPRGVISRSAVWGGFALGLLAVPLVMVALASALTWMYAGLDGPGEYGLAVAGTRRLASALDRYRARYQHIPTAKEGLAKLAPELIEHVPNDPWGHPYIYDPSGPDWADVLSFGSDGRAGGGGDAADISARYGRLGARPPGWLHSFATLVLMGLALAGAVAGARRRWCAAMFAGVCAFWGILLLATLSGTLWGSLLTPLSLIAGLACLTASVALLRELPYARMLGLLATIAAYALLQNLVSSS